jgi:coproporphyrinogen III oxidase
MTLNPHETVIGVAHRTLQEPARLWFEALRDRLCAAFEAIEHDFAPAGARFEQ